MLSLRVLLSLALASIACAGVATVEVFGLDGALKKKAEIEVPAEGMGAFEALVELSEEGVLPMSYQRMGSPKLVPVIMSFFGEAASFPSTGWYQDHVLANGERVSNVGVLDVTLREGEGLVWRHRKFGSLDPAAAAKAAAAKHEAERKAQEAAAGEL